MAKIRNLFPTPVYQARLESGLFRRLNPVLLKEAYVFRGLDGAGRAWSKERYVQGYTSYSSVTDLPYRSPNFEELRRVLDRHAAAFARRLDMDLGGRRLTMTDCWVNIMGHACHHSFHLHPLSVLSGTYFVSVPKNAGPFRVEDPRLAAFMGSPPRRERCREANRRFVDFDPRAGEILFFESWLKHEVPANRAREDRVSVSFNYGLV